MAVWLCASTRCCRDRGHASRPFTDVDVRPHRGCLPLRIWV